MLVVRESFWVMCIIVFMIILSLENIHSCHTPSSLERQVMVCKTLVGVDEIHGRMHPS